MVEIAYMVCDLCNMTGIAWVLCIVICVFWTDLCLSFI